MINETLLNGNREGNQFFIAAVSVSLLLHVAVLWVGRNISFTADITSPNQPFAPMEVVIASVAQHKNASVPTQESRQSAVVPRPAPVMSRTEQTVPTEKVVPAADVVPEEAPAGESEASSALNPAAAASSRGGNVSTSEPAAREHYLAAVLRCIESHKFYPEPARRRGLQGSVEVSFWIDAEGVLTQLLVKGRNPMLEKAARDAVNNAIPLPPAPSGEGFPMQVRYEMVFRLQ